MIVCWSIGAGEVILIVILAIFVLGPEKTPYYAKKLGEGLGLMKQYSGKLATEIKENVAEPLSEVVQPLQEVSKEMREPFKDITDPLKEIKAPLTEATRALNNAVNVTAQPLKTAVNEAAAEVEAAGDAQDMAEDTPREDATAVTAEAEGSAEEAAKETPDREIAAQPEAAAVRQPDEAAGQADGEADAGEEPQPQEAAVTLQAETVPVQEG